MCGMAQFQGATRTRRAASIAFASCLWVTACSNGAGDEAGDEPQGQSGNGGASSLGSGGKSGSGGTTVAGSGGPPPSGSGGTTAGGGGSPSTGTGGNSAAGTGGAPGVTDGGAIAEPTTGPFPAVSDLSGDGPYTATTMSGVGPNSNYTVYLPTELAPNGARNPIVVWMSGGGTGPDLYPLLPHLATHGFFVVASNTIPAAGDEAALGQELTAGIGWALAENGRAESMLFGKLDETKIASMGYSMGSLATFTIADDERLTTTLHISGGNMVPETVNKLRQPAAFFCGIPDENCSNLLDTACDIAGFNCKTDFMNATTPVFYAYFNYGHLGILTDPYTALITSAATGWLRWKLMGDTTLAAMFVGDQCTLCQDTSNWTVQQKGLQ